MKQTIKFTIRKKLNNKLKNKQTNKKMIMLQLLINHQTVNHYSIKIHVFYLLTKSPKLMTC